MTEVKTVAALIAVLQTMPKDARVFQRGNMGDWVEGIDVDTKKLAKHKVASENYHADLTDPVWKKTKKAFGPEFVAVILE
jgi:hypothetical protein